MPNSQGVFLWFEDNLVYVQCKDINVYFSSSQSSNDCNENLILMSSGNMRFDFCKFCGNSYKDEEITSYSQRSNDIKDNEEALVEEIFSFIKGLALYEGEKAGLSDATFCNFTDCPVKVNKGDVYIKEGESVNNRK